MCLFFCAVSGVRRRPFSGAAPDGEAEMAEEQETLVKSRARVADHGEVFTPRRIVRAMCDLVRGETLRIDSRFLEPACGDGNFLAEILRRKLEEVQRRYRRSAFDYERFSLLALGSLYGVDILADNAAACRERLFGIWNAAYTAACGAGCAPAVRESARFILSRNIVCGNALTLRRTDDRQRGTGEPIVFSEWSLPGNDAYFLRRDYTFENLLNGNAHPDLAHTGPLLPEEPEPEQGELFEDAAAAPAESEAPLKEIRRHYRRLADHD